MSDVKVKLQDKKTRGYNDETYAKILARLVKADANRLLDYSALCQVRNAIDEAMLDHLKKAIEDNMDYCPKFEVISKYSKHNWIECVFSDRNITYDISISTDREGNYYLLSNDNIRKVENNGDYRFSVKEIQATQDRIREIAHQVFNAFNINI